ncbi:MAG: apolipoprotein N-acyltransferase [Pyrinomonadaceae bacterium]|nr:apolipoprotein N-acyltransferase [Pyrinomonadaceae bacterium]
MSEAVQVAAQTGVRRLSRIRARARAAAPTRVEIALAVASSALLILSFPDFNLWPLAWVALVPLLVAVAGRPEAARSFLLGWITATVFFFGSCYWLTYAMVRYGHIPAWIAYPLVVPGAMVVGIFPALCCLLLARLIVRRGTVALIFAPLLWAALEWARLAVTGQLWNALGYSQAYVTPLIQSASWGGVYSVSFLIVAINSAITYALIKRTVRAVLLSLLIAAFVGGVMLASNQYTKAFASTVSRPDAVAIAVQPNVPMEPVEDLAETEALVERHRSLSKEALGVWERQGRLSNGDVVKIEGDRSQDGALASRQAIPRLVIWPESPMNFTYANDTALREWIARFATENRVAVILNSLEPAPAGGAYNSALMINEEGRKVSQYDKIRLLPFGEYVPLPRWLPGVNLVPVMVGDFTPGADYPLMQAGGGTRVGVFICFESAFPSISREFAGRGADVLINISNDGYLGPTPVMRQHLANTVFRAVENGRAVVRVTNTGISAYITPRGQVIGATEGFKPNARVWPLNRANVGKTFYTRYGDLFVSLCALLSLLMLATTIRKSRESGESGEKNVF